MKTLFFYLVLFVLSVTGSAADFYTADLYFNDGSTRSGLAVFIETGGDKTIKFKSSETAVTEKLNSDILSRVVYKVEGEEFEYHRLKVYKGWKQVKITENAGWLQVVQKGIATLYINQTVMYSRNSYGQETGSATFKDYYIIRDGEPAAKLIATIASMNNNQTFRAKAPLYFADYPELAKKIKSKEYTWKDMFDVVDMYNEWAATNK